MKNRKRESLDYFLHYSTLQKSQMSKVVGSKANYKPKIPTVNDR